MPPNASLPVQPADQRAAIEPPTRTYRLWTVDMLQAAEAQADGGTLTRAAEVCDALLGDDRIPANLQTRSQGLFGLVPTFEASGDGRRKSRAVRALEADEDWWAMADEAESSLILWWGILLGLGPAELCWYDDAGRALVRNGRNVPRLRFRHPKNLRYDQTLRAWFITVAQGQEVPFTPGDGHWFLYAPYGLNRPWSLGAWRGLARWWLLKLYAIHDWGEHGERGASLFVESSLEADTTRELRKQLASDLAQMAAQGVCVLPPGFKAALLEIAANTAAIYDAQKTAADGAFAVRLLGHNLTSEVKSGSLAAAEVGAGVLLDLRSFDANAWSTAAHDQMLVAWAGVNFADPSLAPWPLYPVAPKADRKAGAEELKILAEALVTLDKAPDYIDKKTILEERGIPFHKDRPITPPPAPAPLAPPPAAPPGDPPPVDQAALGRKPSIALARSPRQATAAGMLWSDRVADAAVPLAADALAEHAGAVLAALEQADGYDDLKARLLALVPGDAPGFEELVYRALILSEGRGAAAVAEETDL